MREIKFRTWNAKKKIMVDLKKITPLALHEMMNLQMELQGFDGLFIPFQKNIPLMQYTGFKDRNGVEIYEGDIVTDGSIVDDYGTKFRSEIVFENAAFRLGKTNCNCGCSNSVLDGEFEVIGNIYENPELLEKENKHVN